MKDTFRLKDRRTALIRYICKFQIENSAERHIPPKAVRKGTGIVYPGDFGT